MNIPQPVRVLWVPALAVAGGIVLGSAAVNLVGRAAPSGTAGPSNSSFPTTSSVATSVPSVPSSAGESTQPTLALAAGWTSSTFPATNPGDQIERIVPLGDELFVVGAHDSQGGIWRSSDGVDWRLAADLPHLDSVLGIQIHGIARGEAGFVAVGANYAVDYASAVIWFSSDGDHWIDVTPERNDCLPIQAITAAGPRFVAVGAVCRYEETGPTADGLSYASADGIHWQRSPASATLVDIGLEDVTWTGGEAIAAGLHFGTWTETLHSLDGLTWTIPASGRLPADSYARRLEWRGDRFVAFGTLDTPTEEPRATVWGSTDGLVWTQHVVGATKSQAGGVVFDGNQWVMVGSLIEGDDMIGPTVEWRSADGIAWGEPEQVFSAGSGYFADLIATPTGLLGIGGVAPEKTGDPWVPVLMRFAE